MQKQLEGRTNIFDFKAEPKAKTVAEVIEISEKVKKSEKHFVVSKNGLLAICNGKDICFGNKNPEEVLNMEVEKVETLYGLHQDYVAIRCK